MKFNILPKNSNAFDLAEKSQPMTSFKRKPLDLNTIPIFGILLSLLFTVDVFFFAFPDISRVCGGVFYSFYWSCFSLLFFLHIYPGIFVIPGLLFLFIGYTFRNRKNKTYLKYCGLLILWCLIVLSGGIFMARCSSSIQDMIVDRKINRYEKIVHKIYSKEKPFGYKDAIGDSESNGDLAFFQYSTGKTDEEDHNSYIRQYYILYSLDTVCDISQVKEDLPNEPLYWYDDYQLEKIKENWYHMEVSFKYW